MAQKTEIDFRMSLIGFLDVLKRSVVGMIITGIIIGGSVGIYSKKCITPKYSAMSSMYIVSASESIINVSDLQIGTSIAGDYVYLIKSRPFITEMKKRLELGDEYTYSKLKSMIAVTNPKDTHAIEIRVTATDATLAADMANALAEVSATRISDIMEISHPKIVEYSLSRGTKVSPNSTNNALISFVLAAFAYFAIALIIHLSDNTVKTLEDVDVKLELNVLGMINSPNAEKSKYKKKKPNNRRY